MYQQQTLLEDTKQTSRMWKQGETDQATTT